jgi:hypothetical protein
VAQSPQGEADRIFEQGRARDRSCAPERTPATVHISEAMIHVASIDNLTKRIKDETTPTWRGTY